LLDLFELFTVENTKAFTLTWSQTAESINRSICDVVLLNSLLVSLNLVGGELGDLGQRVVANPHTLNEVLLEILHNLDHLAWHTLW
jgi:hypothetical protein